MNAPYVCGWCEKEFTPAKAKQRFCSRPCALNRNRTLRKTPFTGKHNPKFNNGISYSGEGRKLKIYPDGSQKLYSRYLVEELLGRTLDFNEIVHHKNGDPTDDSLENLEVMSRADHINLHRAELVAGQRARAAK